MERKHRIPIFAAAAAAAIAGGLVYFLYTGPDEYAIRSRVQKQIAQRIRSELSAIEGLSYQFIANQDLNDSLYAYGKRSNLYDVAVYNLSFTRHLESQNISGLVEEAFFHDFDEPRRIPLTMTEDFLRPEIAEARSFVWTRAVEADGAAVWLDDTLAVHGERYILGARLIKLLKSGEPIGVLTLLVNSRKIAETIDSMSAGEDVPSPLSIVVSPNGMVASASDASLIGRPISNAAANFREFETAIAAGRDSGRFASRYEGRRSDAVFTRISPGGPYLISLFPDRGASLDPRRLLFAAIAAGAAAAGAAAAAAALVDARRMRGGGYTEEGLPPNLPPLSARERQLLRMLARGLSNKEIAGECGIKEQTVKNYLKPLYDKLGVHDRVSALLKLRGNGDVRTHGEST